MENRDGAPGSAAADLSLERLAQRIAEIEARLALTVEPGQASAPDYTDAQLAEVAAAVYHARRRRRRYFDGEIFADPAWDMLLELFIGQVRGKRITTTGLAQAADVPESTGHRWVGQLEQRTLLERFSPAHDGRVKLTRLTGEGYRVMRQYLIDGLEEHDLPRVA